MVTRKTNWKTDQQMIQERFYPNSSKQGTKPRGQIGKSLPSTDTKAATRSSNKMYIKNNYIQARQVNRDWISLPA